MSVMCDTLKNALCMRCFPLPAIGSSYSYCRCNISGSPLTREARADPLNDCNKKAKHCGNKISGCG